jgi:hypothetical protein
MKTNAKAARRAYAADNEQAARIIAADPARYPGVMQEWAALVLERAEPTIRGPLFGKAA